MATPKNIKKLDKLFEERLKICPDNNAVEYYNDKLHFEALNYSQVNEVAEHVRKIIEPYTVFNQANNCCKINKMNSCSVNQLNVSPKVDKDKQCCSFAIGLYMKPSIIFPSIVIGILQAGCYFFPLNVSAPYAVTLSLLKTAQIKYVLTTQDLKNRFLNTVSAEFNKIQLVPFSVNISGLKEHNLFLCILDCHNFQQQFQHGLADLAYVLSTSGTTGNPKLVYVSHQSIISNILHLSKLFAMSACDKVAMCSPLTFDPSIVELFISLTSGATLVIVSDLIKLLPSTFIEILSSARVTIMQATPTLIARHEVSDLQKYLFSNSSSLRLLAIGGESCPSCKIICSWLDTEVLKGFMSNTPKFRFFNLYGITEVSTWATCYEVTINEVVDGNEEPINLGIPLCDTRLDIVDDQGVVLCVIKTSMKSDNFVEHNCENFHIDGFGIINIEIRNQSLTFDKDKKFIGVKGYLRIGSSKRVCYIDVSSENANNEMVMRNSGDLVQLKLYCNISQITKNGYCSTFKLDKLTNFKLLYLGRSDGQVKRHGKRMNLFYVKQKLESLDAVSASHVMMIPSDKSRNSYDTAFDFKYEQQLIAFVMLHDIQQSVTTEEVLSHLRNVLETHCIPNKIIFISKMPMTFHGKVDEAVLEQHFMHCHPENNLFDGSVLSTESFIQHCWNNILNGVNNNKDEKICDSKLSDLKNKNFIKCGGDSFSAVKLTTVLHNVCLHKQSNEFSKLLELTLNGTFNDIVLFVKNVSKIAQKSDDNVSVNVDEVPFSASNRKRLLQEENHFENQQEELSNVKYFKETKKKSVTEKYHYTSLRRGSTSNKGNSLNHVYLKHKLSKRKQFTTGDFLKESSLKLLLKEKWRFDTKKCIDASPLVVIFSSTEPQKNKFVIIGSHSHLLVCISLKTGDVCWETTLGGRIESSACLSLCGKYIIVGCYDYHVYVLNSKTGSIAWKFFTGAEVKSSPCPGVSSSSIIYIGSHDGYLYSLDVENKCVQWRFKFDGSPIFSSPLFYYLQEHKIGVVYFCSLSGKVVSLNQDGGKLRWSIELGKPVFSSPCACDVGVCVGCVDNKVYMLSHDEGRVIWKYETSQPVFSSPCLAILNACETDQVIVFGSHDGKVYCVNSTSGQLIWSFPCGVTNKHAPVYATPYADDVTISGYRISVVTAVTTKGNLMVLSLQDGRCLAQLNMPGDVFSSPVIVQSDITENEENKDAVNVVVGCRDDHLYCFLLTLDKESRDAQVRFSL